MTLPHPHYHAPLLAPIAGNPEIPGDIANKIMAGEDNPCLRHVECPRCLSPTVSMEPAENGPRLFQCTQGHEILLMHNFGGSTAYSPMPTKPWTVLNPDLLKDINHTVMKAVGELKINSTAHERMQEAIDTLMDIVPSLNTQDRIKIAMQCFPMWMISMGVREALLIEAGVPFDEIVPDRGH